MELDLQLKDVMGKLEKYTEEVDPNSFESIEKLASESEKNIRNGVYSSDDIGNLLKAWEYAYSQFDELYSNPSNETLHNPKYRGRVFSPVPIF